MNFIIILMALCMGENMNLPPGIPKDACGSFPVTSWKRCNEHCFIFATFFNNLKISHIYPALVEG